MGKAELKKSVYSVFSDKFMILLGIMAVPIIAGEYLLKPGSMEFLALYAADWIIWLVFLFEFILKVYVEDTMGKYIKENKLDSAVSIIIIVSPIVGIVAPYYSALPALRLIRISRLFKATNVAKAMKPVKAARAVTYTVSASTKEKPVPHEGTFTITRTELRHVLVVLEVNEKDVNNFLGSLDKTHRHTNVIVFANLLEKLGVKRDRMSDVFRRMGMDDVTIINIFRMVDENKISAETGRLYEATLDFS